MFSGKQVLTPKKLFHVSVAVSLLVHVVALAVIFYLVPYEEKSSSTEFNVALVEETPPPPDEPPPPPLEESPPPFLEEPPPPEESEQRSAAREQPGEKVPVVPLPPGLPEEAGEDMLPSGPEEARREGKEPDISEDFEKKERLSKLFDTEVIQEFAKKESEKKDGNGITFDAEDIKYKNYIKALQQKLEGALAPRLTATISITAPITTLTT